MTARRVTRIEGAPEEAWLVTGDPLPPPSGQRWPSPPVYLHHLRRYGFTFLDPTAARP